MWKYSREVEKGFNEVRVRFYSLTGSLRKQYQFSDCCRACGSAPMVSSKAWLSRSAWPVGQQSKQCTSGYSKTQKGFVSMQIRDIMKNGNALQTILPGETLADAARKMRNQKVSALPVVDDNRHVVGMISERDLTGKCEPSWTLLASESRTEDASRLAQCSSEAGRIRVEDAMTKEVVVASENDSVGALLQQMTGRGVNHVPVVKGENLLGMVARQDVLSSLSDFAAKNLKAF